jgi:hypothetical protein
MIIVVYCVLGIIMKTEIICSLTALLAADFGFICKFSGVLLEIWFKQLK